MSDPVNFRGNSAQSGGTMNTGPVNTGYSSHMASGQENPSRLLVDPMSSHTVDGNRKRIRDPKSAHDDIDFTPLSHGVVSGIQYSNWRLDKARLVKRVFHSMQTQDYRYHLIFTNRIIERSNRNSFTSKKKGPSSLISNSYDAIDNLKLPNLEGNHTVYLEEVYTWTQLNFKLYVEQEDLHRKARNNSGRASHQAQMLLANYAMEFMKKFGFCGVCHNEERFGDRNKPSTSPIDLQKLIQTMWIGMADVFNVFGAKMLPEKTPLFFLFKQIEEKDIPHYYQYTQEQVYTVKDTSTHEQITTDSGHAKFRPYQIIPYAKAGCNYPTISDRMYYDSNGEYTEAKVIPIGRLHYNKDDRSTLRRMNSDQSPYDIVSVISQPQMVILLDLKPVGDMTYERGDNLAYDEEISRQLGKNLQSNFLD